MLEALKDRLSGIFQKNSFAHGVGVLVSGTAASQLLMVLTAPILTHLYSPQDFGLVAVYASLLALINVVSSLCYELAIPLPKDDQDAAHLVVLSLVITMASTILTALGIVLFADAIVSVFRLPMLAGYLWLLPISVLLVGAFSIFNYWSIRTKAFGKIASTKLRQTLSTALIQLLGFKLGGVSLLFAQIAGQSVGTASLAQLAFTTQGVKQIRLSGVIAAAKRYRYFPMFSTFSGFANTAGMQLPPLMFAALFSPAVAGFYALAHRVLSLPMSIVGKAIGDVFFANAAEAHRRGDVGLLVVQLHAKLAHIGMPLVLVLVLVGTDIFTLVFGTDWQQAGNFARWMAPWLYFVFVASPLSTLFSIAERQKEGMIFQAVLLISRVFAILFGASIGDIELTVMIFAGVSALCWIGFLFWIAYVAGIPSGEIWLPTLKAFGIALVCTLPLMIGISVHDKIPMAWLYALPVTVVLITYRYWTLLKNTC